MCLPEQLILVSQLLALTMNETCAYYAPTTVELWTNSGFSNEQKQGMLKDIAGKLPTGKVPGPEEIAESYVYLMRDQNITGTMVS